jgi:hypothetical protein
MKDNQFFLFLQVMEHRWNETDREKPSTWGKTCPSATLSTTNPTWTDPGSNPGLRGGRPATNRLSHGTVNNLLTSKHGGKGKGLPVICDASIDGQ